MKNIFIVIGILFFWQPVLSQQKIIVIRKFVVDAKNSKPVEFAHISTNRYEAGTFTTEKGYFVIRLPYDFLHDTLKISRFGYNNYKICIKDIRKQNDTIFLTPKINKLNEVVIKARYNPKKLIRKAKKLRKVNYPYKDMFCADWYYREYIAKDSATVHMIETRNRINWAGLKYFPDDKRAFYRIDSVFYRYHYGGYYWSQGFWSDPLFIGSPYFPKKGKFIIDSVYYNNGRKLIAITHIPKKSDTIYLDKTYYIGNEVVSEEVETVN